MPLRVLAEVDVIASEDTRTTRKLLTHFGIRTRMLSFQEHNAAARIPQLLQALEEHDVALVTEAGTPGVSDPGASLVAAARRAWRSTVVAVPGPSAVTAAVSVSGFSGDRFHFIGWPPRRAVDRRRFFESLADEQDTLVALESPRRVLATLAAMQAAWGDRRVAVCRELTKLHEEVFHGTLQEAIDHFAIAAWGVHRRHRGRRRRQACRRGRGLGGGAQATGAAARRGPPGARGRRRRHARYEAAPTHGLRAMAGARWRQLARRSMPSGNHYH